MFVLRLVLTSLCLGGFLAHPAYSQSITAEQVFPVQGYSVFQQGYPPMVAPAGAGKFLFVEFWKGGNEGRNMDNMYLQQYGFSDYVEHWFHPVTESGQPRLEVIDLKYLPKSIAVIGHEYDASSKEVHTVSRWFTHQGEPKTKQTVRLSHYLKRPRRNYQESVELSPNRQYLLWWGGDEKMQYASVRDAAGQAVWKDRLQVPGLKEKYSISKVLIEDRTANLVFFLTPKTSSTGPANKPLLISRYLHEEKKFVTLELANSPETNAFLPQVAWVKGDLVVAGCEIAFGGGDGLKLGSEESNKGTINRLQQVFMHRIGGFDKNLDSLTLIRSMVQTFPQKWKEQYAINGTDFHTSRLLVEGDMALFMMEEFKVGAKRKLYFYDIGILGFDTQKGEIAWDAILKKQQRDQGSTAFMSYVSATAKGKLRLIYLTEKGARGKVVCSSFDAWRGTRKDVVLASNEEAKYFFFPANSGKVGQEQMVLVGMGRPGQNDYKLISVTF